jgi:hypothetical protein
MTMLNRSNSEPGSQAQQVQELMVETLRRYAEEIDKEVLGAWGREIQPGVIIRVYRPWRYYPHRRTQYEGPLGIWLMRVDQEGNSLERPTQDEEFAERWKVLQHLRKEELAAHSAWYELTGQLPIKDKYPLVYTLDEYEARWGAVTPARLIDQIREAWSHDQELFIRLGTLAHDLGLPIYDVSERLLHPD